MTILSHNVFWFQGMPLLSNVPQALRVEVLEALVELYGEIDPDVFCFQEIQSADVFRLLGESLGLSGIYCSGRMLVQYGGAIFWHSRTRFLDAINVRDYPQRMWQIFTIGLGKGDNVTLCNIHLPSNRQLRKEVASRRRFEELQAATRTFPKVVLGDFNEEPGGILSDFMNGQGYRDSAELFGQGKRPTTIKGKRIDQIWIHELIGDWVVDYGVMTKDQLSTCIEGKTHLSDHLPVWIRLKMKKTE